MSIRNAEANRVPLNPRTVLGRFVDQALNYFNTNPFTFFQGESRLTTIQDAAIEIVSQALREQPRRDMGGIYSRVARQAERIGLTPLGTLSEFEPGRDWTLHHRDATSRIVESALVRYHPEIPSVLRSREAKLRTNLVFYDVLDSLLGSSSI